MVRKTEQRKTPQMFFYKEKKHCFNGVSFLYCLDFGGMLGSLQLLLRLGSNLGRTG